jgi:hypothetical protein
VFGDEVLPPAAVREPSGGLAFHERVTMNCAKTKPNLQDQQLSCYRVWMRPKPPARKLERRSPLLLGQYLLSTRK